MPSTFRKATAARYSRHRLMKRKTPSIDFRSDQTAQSLLLPMETLKLYCTSLTEMSPRKLCNMYNFAFAQAIPAKVSTDGLLHTLEYKSMALSGQRTEGMSDGIVGDTYCLTLLKFNYQSGLYFFQSSGTFSAF